MKAAQIIAACLAVGAQPEEAEWFAKLINSEINKLPAKLVQSDDEKAYLMNKAEQKRNRKNMKRIVKL